MGEIDGLADLDDLDLDAEFAIASYTPRQSLSPTASGTHTPRVHVDAHVDSAEFDLYEGEVDSDLEREFLSEFGSEGATDRTLSPPQSDFESRVRRPIIVQ